MNALSQTSPGFTLSIAEMVAGISYEGLLSPVRICAQQALLDITGVTLAAASHPLLAPLHRVILAEPGRGDASVIGRSERIGARNAALLNGTAAHLLDYDDVHTAMQGHPSAPIVPAVLALAEAIGTSGADIMAAIVAGYEAAGRIGAAFGTDHYARGFHATATIGTFAAAAGCANLMKLDARRTAHALGFAATQAAGLKAMFGTFGKPLHAGKAAEAGLFAALLAAEGGESRPDAIEGKQGFAETHSGFFDPALGLAMPAMGYHILDGLYKYHACCFDTHAGIDNIRTLSQDRPLELDQIARVRVVVDRSEDSVCNIQAPRTGLECKFSLRMTTAMALAGLDTADPRIFTDSLPQDPKVQAWVQLVEVDATGSQPQSSARTLITFRDGTAIEATSNPDHPERDLAKQGETLLRKFRLLASPVLGAEQAQRLADAILDLPSTSSNQLGRLLARSTKPSLRHSQLARSGTEG